MKKDASISVDRKYRYLLSRVWDETKPMVMIIGLNPSTADEKEDDPTIRKCINYAKSWDYGGIYMLNLFAFRATQPSEMFKASEPIGEKNDTYIKTYSKKVNKVICAWGNDGKYQNRSNLIKNSVDNLYYLKLNQTGEPAHPLYLKAKLTPKKF
jgi:hypothetical protein